VNRNNPLIVSFSLALTAAAIIYLSGVHQPVTFILAWTWLIVGPGPQSSAKPSIISPPVLATDIYRLIYLVMMVVFALLCLFHSFISNYILWLKACYYIAFSARLMTACYKDPPPRHYWLYTGWLNLWALLALTPILWTPTLLFGNDALHYLALAIIMWAIMCTLFLSLIRYRPTHGFYIIFLSLGPVAPLIFAWPQEACWLLAPITALLTLIKCSPSNQPSPDKDGEQRLLWFPLWLLRTCFFLWWCLGCAVSISLAWWLPGQSLYFEYNPWLKAIALGMILVTCGGLLVEYAMPLLGRPEPEDYWRRDHSWGPILSSFAILLALVPTLLFPEKNDVPPYTVDSARATLMDTPVTLTEDNQEIVLSIPTQFSDLSRIYIVSHLLNGQDILQAQGVGMVMVTGENQLPYINYLRAGIDTAERDIGQSKMMVLAQHEPVAYTRQTLAFSPEGQAFYRQSYLTGFILQNPPSAPRGVTISFMPLSQFIDQTSKPYLVIEKVMIE
jgi:hypothetical protein